VTHLNGDVRRVSVKRNIVANYFGAGWTPQISLAFIPVYIRYLGTEVYGLIDIIAVLQAGLVPDLASAKYVMNPDYVEQVR
jgi:hypothetical protein